MAFQKCPVCQGTGKSTTEFGNTCHVCNGHGIIDEFTGSPPPDLKPVIDRTDIPFNICKLCPSKVNYYYIDHRYRPAPYWLKDDFYEPFKITCDIISGNCVPPTQTEE